MDLTGQLSNLSQPLRELLITGTFRYANTWPTAIALAASGRVSLDELVTGGDLLQDALIRAVAGARQFGARAVVVDAIDDRAVAFYRHHGFLPLEGRRLYRRVSDIERAVQA